MKILFLILFESNLNHAVAHGCNKCNKVFPGGVGQRDYSGFDVDHWEQRTKEQHNKCVKLFLLIQAKCKTNLNQNLELVFQF